MVAAAADEEGFDRSSFRRAPNHGRQVVACDRPRLALYARRPLLGGSGGGRIRRGGLPFGWAGANLPYLYCGRAPTCMPSRVPSVTRIQRRLLLRQNIDPPDISSFASALVSRKQQTKTRLVVLTPTQPPPSQAGADAN